MYVRINHSNKWVKIFLVDDAKLRAFLTQAHVTIHWQKQAEGDLIRDEKLGVLERVPFDESGVTVWWLPANKTGHQEEL